MTNDEAPMIENGIISPNFSMFWRG